MTGALVPVAVDAEVLADALGSLDGYRVLRRLAPMDRRFLRGMPGGAVTGLAVALAASGPDPARHAVLALAVQSFVLDADCRVVDVGPLREWFEPSDEPVLQDVLARAGLASARLAGRSIPDGEASCLAMTSDFVVSLAAAKERPFFEARLSLATGLPWACAVEDVGWSGLGCADASLPSLLADIGLYAEGSSPGERVAAIPHLLDREVHGGGTVACRMLASARNPTWMVEASEAPASAEEVLVDRGYSWDRAKGRWSVEVGDGLVGEEDAWASLMLYGGRRRAVVRRVDWTERYACAE